MSIQDLKASVMTARASRSFCILLISTSRQTHLCQEPSLEQSLPIAKLVLMILQHLLKRCRDEVLFAGRVYMPGTQQHDLLCRGLMDLHYKQYIYPLVWVNHGYINLEIY